VIYANNQEIKTADILKLLGVSIDSKLNFLEHVSLACKLATQRIGVLMRLRNLTPKKAKLQALVVRKGNNAIHRVNPYPVLARFVLLTLIHWIAIYPLHSVIQPLNNWGQLYKSAVLPYLTYCHLSWHFCRASDACKLERLQERGLRADYKDEHRAKLST